MRQRESKTEDSTEEALPPVYLGGSIPLDLPQEKTSGTVFTLGKSEIEVNNAESGICLIREGRFLQLRGVNLCEYLSDHRLMNPNSMEK